MLSAEAEFVRRKAEVDEYIVHLENMEAQFGISATLMNTMKSSALLMMYNVIESTMTNLLQDLFDHLGAHKVSFDVLNDSMKTVVLTHGKKKNPTELVQLMKTSAMSFVVACFDRSNVFSGNIDAQKIRETLKNIGVPTQHNYREPALLKVKAERNDLAHGVKSFSDCGRHYSARQIKDFHGRTCAMLQKVILDFEVFLQGQSYK